VCAIATNVRHECKHDNVCSVQTTQGDRNRTHNSGSTYVWTVGSCVTSQILDYSNSLALTTQTQVIPPFPTLFHSPQRSRSSLVGSLSQLNLTYRMSQ
jgi:hypothetical protein